VTQEFYFYGIGGQKLVTLPCVTGENGLGCPAGPQYNVYFGGKLVKSKGVVVVTDRLGSVRANSNGERMSYYPYGEEKTSTADGREKFGTYTRDSAGLEYADQRYYGVGTGRFLTADQTGISAADRKSSVGWNSYAYVSGDPLNFNDSTGNKAFAVDFGGTGSCAGYAVYLDSIYYGCSGGGSSGSDGGYCGGNAFLPSPDPTCYAPVDYADDGYGFVPTCEETETAWVSAYLRKRGSPLAAYADRIVAQSDAAGVDDRFIVALAGAETTYGKNTSATWGKYNAWSDSAHCSIKDGDCQTVNPFSSWLQAISAAITNITGSLYFGTTPALTTTDAIYYKYSKGGSSDLLNTIYLNQMGGGLLTDKKQVNFSRCED
jgi:RHS repeat-associated protein